MRAAAWYGVRDPAWPPQYLLGREQLIRTLRQDRSELEDLKMKVKPKARRDLMAAAAANLPRAPAA